MLKMGEFDLTGAAAEIITDVHGGPGTLSRGNKTILFRFD
jgi:hypothetical protein